MLSIFQDVLSFTFAGADEHLNTRVGGTRVIRTPQNPSQTESMRDPLVFTPYQREVSASTVCLPMHLVKGEGGVGVGQKTCRTKDNRRLIGWLITEVHWKHAQIQS